MLRPIGPEADRWGGLEARSLVGGLTRPGVFNPLTGLRGGVQSRPAFDPCIFLRTWTPDWRSFFRASYPGGPLALADAVGRQRPAAVLGL